MNHSYWEFTTISNIHHLVNDNLYEKQKEGWTIAGDVLLRHENRQIYATIPLKRWVV